MEDELLTIEEAAEYLEVRLAWLNRRILKDHIEKVEGNKVRKSSIERYNDLTLEQAQQYFPAKASILLFGLRNRELLGRCVDGVWHIRAGDVEHWNHIITD